MLLLPRVAGLLVTSGCMSMHLVQDKAQPHQEYRVDRDTWEQVNGKPGYYALLPLTVTGDVATSPFQLGYFLFRDATIFDVPIPLP